MIRDFKVNSNKLTYVEKEIPLALKKANAIDFEEKTCIT